ncbi:MAG: DHH family phosphoesterase [Candidatus Aenigmarchaeota archaeon]|nr:DHH family phosphoesterase [Candidatus Aenigmarchaeota archaeon]
MQKIIKYLKELKGKTLLLTHHNADLDAVASCLVLKNCLEKYGKEVYIGTSESISKLASNLQVADIIIDPDCNNYDNIILIETSVLEQLKTIKNLRVDAIIDHHPPGNLASQAKIKFIDENKKSCAQIIFEICKNMKYEINSEDGKVLLAGIIFDTAHFSHADKEVFKNVLEIIEKTNINIQDAFKFLEVETDISEKIACIKALSRLNAYRINDILIVFSVAGSFEGPIARTITKLGADIAVIANIKEDEIRISSRGKEKIKNYGIDLSEIFKEVGKIIDGSGGGHDLAGSANGKNKKALNKAFNFILNTISKRIGKPYKKI